MVAQGYYWPEVGPQNTIYIPGPLLRACNNELVLLELGTTMTANASAIGAFARFKACRVNFTQTVSRACCHACQEPGRDALLQGVNCL